MFYLCVYHYEDWANIHCYGTNVDNSYAQMKYEYCALNIEFLVSEKYNFKIIYFRAKKKFL